MALFNLLKTGTVVITFFGLALILSCGDDNSPADSQIPVSIVWEKVFGGVGDELANFMVTTNDGGAMLVGSTTSFGSGGKDVYLAKINSTGDTVWTRTFGGPDEDEGNSIAPVSDGSFIVCGYTKSYGAGGYDIYLIKVDASGNKQWEKTYGSEFYEIGRAAIETRDSGLLITGLINSPEHILSDAYVIKTDCQGDTLWTRAFGAANADQGNAAIATSDSGCLIAGLTESATYHANDPYLIRLNSYGDSLWTKTFSSSGNDWVESMVPAPDKGAVILGWDGTSAARGYDILLMRIDSTGNQVWRKLLGSANYDGAFGIATTSDGGFIAAGYLGIVPSGSYGYLAKLNNSGNLLWDKTFGTGATILRAAAQTGNDMYLAAGETLTSGGASQSDIYVVKLKEGL